MYMMMMMLGGQMMEMHSNGDIKCPSMRVLNDDTRIVNFTMRGSYKNDSGCMSIFTYNAINVINLRCT